MWLISANFSINLPKLLLEIFWIIRFSENTKFPYILKESCNGLNQGTNPGFVEVVGTYLKEKEEKRTKCNDKQV